MKPRFYVTEGLFLRWLYRLTYLMLGLLILAFSVRKIASLDVWWHLASGRWIWQHGSVPKVEIFSYTAAGWPWVDVWWGFQVLAYPLVEWLGLNSLIFVKSFLILAAFCVSFRTVRKEHRGLLLILLIFFGVLIGQLRFHIRPTAFTFLFLATYIWILEDNHRRGSRWIWSLPLLHLIWSNIHGVATVGIVLVLFYAIAGFWKSVGWLPWKWDSDLDKRFSYTSTKDLICVASMCLGVSVINPYGLEGLVYAWGQIFWITSDAHALARLLEEHWSPFSKQMSVHRLTYFSYWAFTILTTVSFFLNYRNLRIVGVLVYGSFLFLFLSAMRNSVLFAIAVIPFCAENYGSWWERSKVLKTNINFRNIKAAINICLLLALTFTCLDVISGDYYRRDLGDFEFGLGIQSGLYPEGTTQFLADSPIQGNLFNDLNLGGYLLWKLSPKKKVFIDPRNFVFGEVGKTYAYGRGHPEAFFQAVDKYKITHALLRHVDPANNRLLKELYERQDWRLLKCDDVSALFVYDPTGPNKAIDRLDENATGRIELFSGINPSQIPAREKLWNYSRAITRYGRLFMAMGNLEQAKWLFERACPDFWYPEESLSGYEVYSPAFLEMGFSLLATKDFKRAIQYLEKGRKWDPLTRERFLRNMRMKALVDEKLGLALEQTGEGEKAIEVYESGASTNRASSRLFYRLANLYLKQRDFDEAILNFEKAINQSPENVEAHCNLGLAWEFKGNHQKAIAQYQKAIEVDPKLTVGLNNLGRLFALQGDIQQAHRLWRRSLKVDPKQKKVQEWLSRMDAEKL